jgi:hypothetical protein
MGSHALGEHLRRRAAQGLRSTLLMLASVGMACSGPGEKDRTPVGASGAAHSGAMGTASGAAGSEAISAVGGATSDIGGALRDAGGSDSGGGGAFRERGIGGELGWHCGG